MCKKGNWIIEISNLRFKLKKMKPKQSIQKD